VTSVEGSRGLPDRHVIGPAPGAAAAGREQSSELPHSNTSACRTRWIPVDDRHRKTRTTRRTSPNGSARRATGVPYPTDVPAPSFWPGGPTCLTLSTSMSDGNRRDLAIAGRAALGYDCASLNLAAPSEFGESACCRLTATGAGGSESNRELVSHQHRVGHGPRVPGFSRIGRAASVEPTRSGHCCRVASPRSSSHAFPTRQGGRSRNVSLACWHISQPSVWRSRSSL